MLKSKLNTDLKPEPMEYNTYQSSCNLLCQKVHGLLRKRLRLARRAGILLQRDKQSHVILEMNTILLLNSTTTYTQLITEVKLQHEKIEMSNTLRKYGDFPSALGLVE